MRKKAQRHLIGNLVSRPSRVTPKDLPNCCLCPGDHGQWVTQALQLDDLQPYLLYWAWLAVEGGMSFVAVRRLLKQAGLMPNYMWTRKGSSHQRVAPVRDSA